jgi:hypothetical protein
MKPLYLILALEEVSEQTHNKVLYTQGKNFNKHQMAPRTGKHVLEKIKNFLLLPGIWIHN